MKKVGKFTCLILAMAMIFTSVPLDVMASELPGISEEAIKEEITQEDVCGEISLGDAEEGLQISDEAETEAEAEEITDEELTEEITDEELAEDTTDEELAEGTTEENSEAQSDAEEAQISDEAETEAEDEEISDELTEEVEITVLEGQVEGEDYEAGSVYAIVDTIGEAEEIADFFGIILESYDYSVAYYKLPSGVSVAEIVQMSVDNEEGYPVLYANHYGSVSDSEVYAVDNAQNVSESSDAELCEEELPEDDMELSSYMSENPELKDEGLLKENHLYPNPQYSNYQWHHDVIGSTYAWTSGIKGKDMKVAILSTGIYQDSGDIVNSLKPLDASRTKIAGSYYAPDGSEDVDKCYETSLGHGTVLAELIGEEINNSGGVGIAPECSFYNIKITEGTNTIVTESNLIKAINYASRKDIDVMVIDARFSYPLSTSYNDGGENLTIEKVLAFARSEGIAVFAPCQNGSDQNEAWPAAYPNVIAVTATDKNNQHLPGTSYSSNTDLAAPGELVTSLYTTSTGTLPAVAIAAGEAALILSQKSSIKALCDDSGSALTGEDLVEALEKHMKASTIPAGKECGAGIVYLPKALSLGTITTTPTAPTINDLGDVYSGGTDLSYRFSITDHYYGIKLFYTTNGKNPVYKNGQIDANSKEYPLGTSYIEEPIDITKNDFVIKAIAVDEKHGLVSPVTTKTIQLNEVKGIVITAPTNKLYRGATLKCTATVVPNNKYTSGVTWKVVDYYGNEQPAIDAKVTVNSSGVVSAKKGTGLGAGTFYVNVYSKKNDMYNKQMEIQVEDAPGFKKLEIPDRAMRNRKINTSETGENLLKNVYITTSDGTQQEAWGRKDDIVVTSSNTKVVAVKRGTDLEGHTDQWISDIKGPGKATITASCMNLKVSFTLDIVQNARSLKLSGGSRVVAGQSLTLTATPNPANASIGKVTWELYNGYRSQITNDKRIKISNGKITTTKELPEGTYYVMARANNRDGSEAAWMGGDLNNAWPITVASADKLVKKLELDDPADKNCKIFTDKNAFDDKTSKEIRFKITGGERDDSNHYPIPNHFEVTSSNEKIVTVTSAESVHKKNYLGFTINSVGVGKATITIKALDGGNAKVSFNVSVVNPASAVRIVPAKAGTNMAVLKGKSIILKAVVVEEYGKVSNKNVTWSFADSNSEKYATINPKTGEIKAKTDSRSVFQFATEPIYVKATAADGSGAYGQSKVDIINDYGKFEICDVNGKTVGTDGKAIKATGTIHNNYGRSRGDYSKIDFYVRIHPSEGGDWSDLATVSSSNPALATVALEGEPAWYGKKVGELYPYGGYDCYHVYHFVGRCVTGTSDNTTGTVKFTVTMLDGTQKLTYSLKVTK